MTEGMRVKIKDELHNFIDDYKYYEDMNDEELMDALNSYPELNLSMISESDKSPKSIKKNKKSLVDEFPYLFRDEKYFTYLIKSISMDAFLYDKYGKLTNKGKSIKELRRDGVFYLRKESSVNERIAILKSNVIKYL